MRISAYLALRFSWHSQDSGILPANRQVRTLQQDKKRSTMPIEQQTYSANRSFFQQKESRIPDSRQLDDHRTNTTFPKDTRSCGHDAEISPAGIKANRFPFSSLQIIIAEDHAANREYSKNLLTKLGYHPKTARNGLETIEIARKYPCDLILMDCYMPEVDGKEATRIIRNLEANNALPNQRPIRIIGVTANGNLSEKQACLDAGMDSFINKPLMRNPLNEMLMHFWIELNLYKLNQPMADDIINEFEEVTTTLDNLRREIGSDATNELIQDFIHSTPERLEEMQAALNAQSMTDLRRIAHSYKSVCQIYGLTLMSTLCAKLEMQALSENKGEAQLLIDQIRQLFIAVLPVIKSTLSESA